MGINQAVLEVDICRYIFETGCTCIVDGKCRIDWRNQKRGMTSMLPHADLTEKKETHYEGKCDMEMNPNGMCGVVEKMQTYVALAEEEIATRKIEKTNRYGRS